MIRFENNVFYIETKNTGYYFRINNGLLENLHYGAKIDIQNILPLCEKLGAGLGGDIIYKKEGERFSAEQLCLELSPAQKGDYRQAGAEIIMPSGSYTADFIYEGHNIILGSLPVKGLAAAYGGSNTLTVSLKTPEGVAARLFYTAYEESDVITRRIEIENNNKKQITIKKLLSYQLDLPKSGLSLATFTGAWARERHETRFDITTGTFAFGSTTGASSYYCNPFFMVYENDATEHFGDVYGFNLIYSGNHEGFVSQNSFGKTRIAAGVQHQGFEYTLQQGEVFYAPEAVLTFCNKGKNGMSQNMHSFVNRHIVRGSWQNRPRPVLCNNWEATYFKFTEGKILKMARTAAELGIELFVLDDGWFGTRNDDKQGLGDYDVNKKKLPAGLTRLADKINSLGMKFGLWFEPEMVNENSKLYQAHPDWAVKTPDNIPCEGRNQLVLDLCNRQVREYIIKNVNDTLKSADIAYVKWDMNRHISDAFSPCLSQQGRFNYEYIKGLYEIMQAITDANPEILFEGCSSGGNRFDLGVLCYMPQIWTSDNTDAYQRLEIQAGTSYGYPQSTISCHVSAVPNHQTARQSPIEGRFDVAAFGVLGYELDFNLLSPAETKVVKAQIQWYKQHRELMQYGSFYRIKNPVYDGKTQWLIVSGDKSQAALGEFTHLLMPNSQRAPIRLCGLDENEVYNINVRTEYIDILTFGSMLNYILPVKVNTEGHIMHAAADLYMLKCEDEGYRASGSLLMGAGLKLKQAFTGTGYNENVRLLPDFSGRIYYLSKEVEDEL